MKPAEATIREQGVVAIVRTSTADEARAAVDTLVAAGLQAVEVSLVTPGALDVIRDAAASAPVGTHIGVGTALSAEDVMRAADAGATFAVAPIVNRAAIEAALAAGMVALPGAATPTEALAAVEAGATLVKLFPASLWSPSVLRETLVALPQLSVVPTGGVTLDSATEWIAAGAVAVGIGGALTRAADPGEVARGLLAAISAARAG